jgi:hypothetical protein
MMSAIVLSRDRLIEIKQTAQLYGSSNGWTGTSGMLASCIVELLREIERLNDGHQNDLAELPDGSAATEKSLCVAERLS